MNFKNKALIVFISLMLLATFSIHQVVASNEYEVNADADFRWDATKYIFLRDGGGLGVNLEYTQHYSLEFNLTNFAEPGGYLNGTLNSNGTEVVYSLSHKYYYTAQTYGQEWVTDVLDYQGTYPVHVYLICTTEIDQTTRPELQTIHDSTYLTLVEPSTNNFTLSGSDVSGSGTTYYNAEIEFNEDKVLKRVYDSLRTFDGTGKVSEETYTWTLSYYNDADSSSDPNGDPTVDGFSIFALFGIAGVMILILSKKRNKSIKIE